MSCHSNYCFSQVPIFQNLQTGEFEQIAKMITRKNYERGEMILMAGDYKKKLFVIRKGKVKLVKLLADGSEQIVRISQKGDFFGDTALFQNEPLTTNIEAIEETEICMISGEELLAFLEKTPVVLFKILQQLALRIDNVETNISEICHKNVAARVASFLLKQQPIVAISKKDMASYLGTTRESISRKLSDFQKSGYIRQHKNEIHVMDVHALQEIASNNFY